MVLGFCTSLWSRCRVIIRRLPSSVVFTWSLHCSYSSPSISLRAEACLSLNPPRAFSAQNGSVGEVKLELEFKRYEEYERGVQTKGPAGIHHGGEGVREDALAPLSRLFSRLV